MRRSLLSLALLVGLSFHFLAAPIYALSADPRIAADAAIAWLETQQLADGSFPGFSVGDKGFDPIFAYVAAGIDPRRVARPGGQSLMDYAHSQAPVYAQASVGGAAKVLLAAVATNDDPCNFGGVDLIAKVTGTYSTTTGAYGGSGAYIQSLALLGLDAAGEVPPAAAIQYLTDLQIADGGWEYGPGFGTDTNATALAIQALIALGRPSNDPSLTKARTYLLSVQSADGGFPFATGSASDANSTGYVLQAIAALGEAPDAAGWTRSGGTPVSALLALQNASGAFRSPFTGADDNVLATLQAVPGLLAKPLPMQLKWHSWLPLISSHSSS